MFTDGWTSTRGISFTFCEASLFTPSKPEGRAPKNSFCSEPKSMLAIFASSVNSVRKPRQLSSMYCAIGLVDFWPITILVKYMSIWALCFPFSDVFRLRTAQIRALNPLLVLFSFLDPRKKRKWRIKKSKKATLGISREIWCCNRETGRFDKKLGDSRENRESWQVCRCEEVRLYFLFLTCQCFTRTYST